EFYLIDTGGITLSNAPFVDEIKYQVDRLIKKASWINKEFYLIDTGGITLSNAPFVDEIKYQVDLAISEANTIIFVVDGRGGLTDDDIYIAKMLHKTNKKVIVAVNKIDDINNMDLTYYFYDLGFEYVLGISAIHGNNVNELLDIALSDYTMSEINTLDNTISFCMVGKPNTGKSSLTNALLNEKRVIVSSIAGTTTDSIDSYLTYENQNYCITDTAGLKRKSVLEQGYDTYSYLRSILSIERSDVCLLVLDATNMALDDKHVAGIISDYFKACVIIVNKWDLIEKETNTMKKMTDDIRSNYKFLDYTEVIFISAIKNSRTSLIWDAIKRAYTSYTKEIKTSILNSLINDAYMTNPPQNWGNKRLHIHYSNQTGIKPPTFNIFVNDETSFHFSYKRYLENYLREKVDFTGSPIKFDIRSKKE
ncbi:MAG: ribosome biogenesis GTPase Der, partial [Acholeplasmatales bacterium]|nr:ribosome biogenesis GTPase Der [Acholeplasmatales bacterium]